MRLPSEEPNSQPFWIGHDTERVWFLVGTLAPNTVHREVDLAAPETGRVRPAWSRIEIDLARLQQTRAALQTIGVEIPPSKLEPTFAATDRVQWTTWPSDRGVRMKLTIPPSLVRLLARQIKFDAASP